MVLRLHCRVRGVVQGVFFRRFCADAAGPLGITGFTKNMEDGSVLVVAEGEAEDLKKMLAKLGEGNQYSRVDAVEPVWEDATGEFDRFEIR